MADKTNTIQNLKDTVKEFIQARQWDSFHSPKNLSIALSAEVAELMELFMWCESSESKQRFEQQRQEVGHEIVDILIYLLNLSWQHAIDLSKVLENKYQFTNYPDRPRNLMTDKNTPIETLKTTIKEFTIERDWNKFHSPKNICMALSVEASELLELFMWCESKESHKKLEEKREKVEEEAADVLYWLLQLCWQHNIDLSTALEKKMAINAQHYPVEKCKGTTLKYTEL